MSSAAMSKIAPRTSPASALPSENILPEPLDRRQLVQELREGIDRNDLFVCYQPKFSSRMGAIDAVEALVRWQHPLNGLIPPDQFIGVAEDNGLIADLTKWVVARVLADRERLQVAGHDLAFHVNMSGSLTADAAFTDWLVEAAQDLQPGALGLEITAAALHSDPRQTMRNLKVLAKAGLMITVDDYGKGAWSLADLKQMPAGELKIDRTLIAGLTSNRRDPLLVRATIDLAHALDMQVTAVGVESDGALALLRTMGCDLIQGFVISPAIEMVDLQDFLAVGAAVQPGAPELQRTAV